MPIEALDPQSTALVLIDLQNGIVGGDLAPRTGSEVVAAALGVAARFRDIGATVILTHVEWHRHGGDLPPGKVDEASLPDAGALEPGWSDIVGGLAERDDLVVLKHQWGAFVGTDLDVQLRRRGVGTIVLGGISTNAGVESTARQAWELGYDVVLVEDLCASRTAAMHDFSIKTIMPLISRVVRADEIHFLDPGR